MASTAEATEYGAPDPPPLGQRGGRAWERRLEPFIGKPGWHKVEGEYARSMVSHLKRCAEGKSTYGYRLPPGRWEFTSRSKGCPEGRVVIWAQYLGPDETKGAA